MTPDQLLAELETALPTLRGAVAGLPSYVPGRRSAGVDIAALASNESHYEPLPAAAAAVGEHGFPSLSSRAERPTQSE